MTECKKCKKALVAIGNQRKNGKEFLCKTQKGSNDWITRQYHKKCWIEHQYYLEGVRLAMEHPVV